jgi:hypothetical protein
MSPDRTRESWSVEPGGPGFPTNKHEVIAYVVCRIANLIEDITRSTPQLARSIVLLWGMIVVPTIVIMWAGHRAGIHINAKAWYAQWRSWVTVGGLGTLTIGAIELAIELRERQHRRKAQGRPPPAVRTAAGHPDPATPGDGVGPDRKGTPRED